MFQKCAPLSAPLFWILWRLWNAIGKPLPSILWNFCDFEGNPRTSETNWKVTAPLSAPLFYTFVNFTTWTKFFLITIWSRNALVWLCRVRSEKHIRSASMTKFSKDILLLVPPVISLNNSVNYDNDIFIMIQTIMSKMTTFILINFSLQPGRRKGPVIKGFLG